MATAFERQQGSPAKDLMRSIPLLGMLLSNAFAFVGSAMLQLTVVWWVLETYNSPILLSILAVIIYLPVNVGVIVSGLLVGRFGARRLLLVSGLAAVLGTVACSVMLAGSVLTFEALAALAFVTYVAIAPAMTAYASRIRVMAQFSGWRISTVHAAGRPMMLVARLAGLSLAGLLVERVGDAVTAAFAAFLLACGLLVIFVSFPRDRPGRKDSFTISAWLTLTKKVLTHERFKEIGLVTVAGLALLTAVLAALFEVVFPLTVSTNQLPVTLLSTVLAAGAIASVIGGVGYRAIDGRIGFLRLPVLLSWVFPLALVVAAANGRLVVVAASVAACAAVGTFLLTGLAATMQKQMPNSLQAQMVGLAQALIFSTSAVAIFVTGATGSISLAFAISTLCLISLFVSIAIGADFLFYRRGGR
jgi:MFS family permease